MSKKRIVTGIGVVLLTTGIIGCIWSGIVAMPKVINNFQIAQDELDKEEVLYKGEINLDRLNINSKVSNVIIKKYDGKDIIVERSGNKDSSTITTKEDNNELTINEESKNHKISSKSIDDMVRYFLNEMYKPYYSKITVYVPDNININVNTDNGPLYIEDINVNNLNYNTSYGQISLNENSHINNLNIKSYGNISLKVREVYSTNNLNIECSDINIYEDTIIKDNYKVPENVKILINKDYTDSEDDSVVIDTNLPIAKKLDITSNEDVELHLPILDYKFNFNINALNKIYVDEDSKNKYSDTPLEKYLEVDDDIHRVNKSTFEGVINGKFANDSSEYFVNIKGANVEFR